MWPWRTASKDAFTEDWRKFTLAYIFPSPVMMELILNRIYQYSKESRFILIYPWKPIAQWFPSGSGSPVDPKQLDHGGRHGQVRPTGGKFKFTALMLS